MIGVRLLAATFPAVLPILSVLSAFSFFILCAAPAQAQQMYRWTDEKGGVHITDTPPPASAKGVQAQKSRSVTPETAAPPAPFELAQAMKDFPITLYTAPNCKEPCEQARRKLNRRGVPFKEVQVWEEEINLELKKLTGGSNDVPVLLVGRSVQKGFQEDAFDALLDSARYPRAGILPARNQSAPKPPEDYVVPGQRPAAPQAQPAKPQEESKPAGPYAPRFSK
jgi:glutaredoxin